MGMSVGISMGIAAQPSLAERPGSSFNLLTKFTAGYPGVYIGSGGSGCYVSPGGDPSVVDGGSSTGRANYITPVSPATLSLWNDFGSPELKSFGVMADSTGAPYYPSADNGGTGTSFTLPFDSDWCFLFAGYKTGTSGNYDILRRGDEEERITLIGAGNRIDCKINGVSSTTSNDFIPSSGAFAVGVQYKSATHMLYVYGTGNSTASFDVTAIFTVDMTIEQMLITTDTGCHMRLLMPTTAIDLTNATDFSNVSGWLATNVGAGLT